MMCIFSSSNGNVLLSSVSFFVFNGCRGFCHRTESDLLIFFSSSWTTKIVFAHLLQPRLGKHMTSISNMERKPPHRHTRCESCYRLPSQTRVHLSFSIERVSKCQCIWTTHHLERLPIKTVSIAKSFNRVIEVNK